MNKLVRSFLRFVDVTDRQTKCSFTHFCIWSSKPINLSRLPKLVAWNFMNIFTRWRTTSRAYPKFSQTCILEIHFPMWNVWYSHTKFRKFPKLLPAALRWRQTLDFVDDETRVTITDVSDVTRLRNSLLVYLDIYIHVSKMKVGQIVCLFHECRDLCCLVLSDSLLACPWNVYKTKCVSVSFSVPLKPFK